MRRPVLLLLASALVAVLVIGLTQAGGEDPGPASGGPSAAEAQAALADAPPPLAALYEQAGTIEEVDAAGYRERVAALEGFPVVVNAWASWCGPCRLEFPYFASAAAKVGDEVAFLGLNVQDSRSAALGFLDERPVPFPHLADDDFSVLREAASGAQGLPVTIFYDARGEVTFVHQGGYRSERDLLADIRRHARA